MICPEKNKQNAEKVLQKSLKRVIIIFIADRHNNGIP